MFGINNLKQRVEYLERYVEIERHKANCAKGVHEWQLSSFSDLGPIVRCKYCYAKPEKNNG